jgi:hypothetical protein
VNVKNLEAIIPTLNQCIEATLTGKEGHNFAFPLLRNYVEFLVPGKAPFFSLKGWNNIAQGNALGRSNDYYAP